MSSKSIYMIESLVSGCSIGAYAGTSKLDALDAMARIAGYTDYLALCDEHPSENNPLEVSEMDMSADRVSKLMIEAMQAGDHRQVAACERALSGDIDALCDCANAILHGRG